MKRLRSVLKVLPAPILLALVGAALLYALGKWDASISERDRVLDQQTRAALEMSKTWSGKYAGAVEASQQDSVELARLRQERAFVMAEADALAREIEGLPEPRLDDAAGWKRRYQLRTMEVEKLRSVVTTAQGELIILRRDRDRFRVLADSAYGTVIPTLETALEAERDARRCRILGLFSCPSRTTAFVAGGVVGALVTFALVR
jgi:hypothetical protein